nr:MAG TPA: hypothetical protein [Caudoviricetes sp.]
MKCLNQTKKSPLRGTGRNVGNTDSLPDRDVPNSPSYRFTRRALAFSVTAL